MNNKVSITKLQQNFEFAHLELNPNKILFAPNHEGIIIYEIFKDIPDYKEYYQISNFGRIKSLSRHQSKTERILRQQTTSHGYLSAQLKVNNKPKRFQVHQLIAITFLNHKPSGFKIVVDHKDNININNFEWNLQLITNRENSSKDKKDGTSKYIGVSWKSSRKKWRSAIYNNGKDIHLGFFTNQKEASNYYQNALKAIQNGTEIKIKRRTETSKYKGVSKKGNRWALHINRNYLGTYITEEEANIVSLNYNKSIVYNEDYRITTKNIPDNFFDWVIDDIPYGINVGKMAYLKETKTTVKQKDGTKLNPNKSKKIYTLKEWDSKVPNQEYFNEMRRISKNQLIFGVEYVDWIGLGNGRVKWNKGFSEKVSFKNYEMAYCSSINYTHEINLLWAGMQQAENLQNPMIQQGNKKLNEKRIHPCHKPILLYKKIALDFDLKGKKIYCGHNGSGSDRIAFDDYVDLFMASEIDKEYFDLQEKRYKEFKNSFKLNIITT